MENNAYFENMMRVCTEWEEKHSAHEKLKDKIIETKGWDSEELDAWYAEKEQEAFPYSQGACKAYRAWVSSLRRGEDELELDDFLWDREVPDFIDTLRKAGIQTFVYTNESTATMGNIHAFAAEGCAMDGPCTVVRNAIKWERRGEAVPGVRFKVN